MKKKIDLYSFRTDFDMDQICTGPESVLVENLFLSYEIFSEITYDIINTDILGISRVITAVITVI